MSSIDQIGADYAIEQALGLTDHVDHVTPSKFNEENRYLKASRYPGYLSYDVTPYAKEIVDCLDPDSPVREINVKKGVQVAFTTSILEPGIFYVAAHLKTPPQMYMTADKELSTQRIENNIIPMFNDSGFGDIFHSADVNNTRKTGKTKDHLQFDGGGVLIPYGANSAAKLRQFSAMYFYKDELDGWPQYVGKDGCPDITSDDRCSAYWEVRKIIRGSTPLIKDGSKIEKRWLQGDQRRYMVRCRSCSFEQYRKWEWVNKDTGLVGGFQWDYDEGGQLDIESVRYCCKNCGHAHFEYDKEFLFSPDNGAYWKPHAKPKMPDIRSYHIPAMYSPIGMQPWYKSVAAYLAGFDPIEKKVIDMGAFQNFYNNVLGEPFDNSRVGSRITAHAVSNHRRVNYSYGEIPNQYAKQFSGSEILLLTMQVDVHKEFLAVAVMGWTSGMRCYLIDYWHLKAKKDCTDDNDPVWKRLQSKIEEKKYTADDGKQYHIAITFVDARYATDTVVNFCAQYESNVYPILGQDRSTKYQKVDEFAPWTTKSGTRGYRITVDHYKDRLNPVLRREWYEESGEQKEYTLNLPANISQKQLDELTREYRKPVEDPKRGTVSYFWYRPSGARNELWDLLVYGHAAVEVVAYEICITQYGMEKIDWQMFWQFLSEKNLFFILS